MISPGLLSPSRSEEFGYLKIARKQKVVK